MYEPLLQFIRKNRRLPFTQQEPEMRRLWDRLYADASSVKPKATLTSQALAREVYRLLGKDPKQGSKMWFALMVYTQ